MLLSLLRYVQTENIRQQLVVFACSRFTDVSVMSRAFLSYNLQSNKSTKHENSAKTSVKFISILLKRKTAVVFTTFDSRRRI